MALLVLVVVMAGAVTGQYYPSPYFYYRRAPSVYAPASPFAYYYSRQNPYLYPAAGQQYYPFNYFRSAAAEDDEEPQDDSDRQPETFYVPAPANGAFGSTLSIQNGSESTPSLFNFVNQQQNRPSSDISNKDALAAAFRSYQPDTGRLIFGNAASDFYYNYQPRRDPYLSSPSYYHYYY